MGTLSPALGGNILPSQNQMALSTNYMSFDSGTATFAQQYLPELYEAEVERYGNRTISSFLRMVGAEIPMTSDQVIWSEQNRLHVAYDNAVIGTAANEIDITTGAGIECAIRVNQTIVISDGTSTLKAIVTVVGAEAAGVCVIEAETYTAASLNAGGMAAATAVSLFVYGSEFVKGTVGMAGSIEPDFTQFSNSPIIIKDKYEINGSDTAQIGWVEVATEDGTSGYLWYLKSESETRLRFEDYLEMAVVEGELAAAGSGAIGHLPAGPGTPAIKGTEGLFAAISSRGHEMQGFSAANSGSTALADFDTILQQLDKEGAIEENMLFADRSLNLDFDDMLGAVNSGYAAGAGVGTSYGLFNNEAEMALNLGFSGFRRGSYDFYKTDWKYLNDASTRGLINDIEGVLVPAGTSTVYDQQLGQNIRRPFLHVRYRASQADDRRMKSWITGSVGGAYTSDLDAMQVQFLSERCLCVQAANNFMLFTT